MLRARPKFAYAKLIYVARRKINIAKFTELALLLRLLELKLEIILLNIDINGYISCPNKRLTENWDIRSKNARLPGVQDKKTKVHGCKPA
jgi:hypothetical protein